MSKLEILNLLQELMRDAVISKSDRSDPSGCNTLYLVDQEQLMKNISSAIDDEMRAQKGGCECGLAWCDSCD
jgi:hypothetical protein